MTTVEHLRALRDAYLDDPINDRLADLNEASFGAMPALLDVAEAARRVSEMRTKRFAEADITTRKIGEPPPWHLLEESRQANAELDAALARLDAS